MRIKPLQSIVMLSLFLWTGISAHAQNSTPYLISATFTLSVDDWADIWLNGIPIVSNQPYTSSIKGPQTIKCLPEHLCYFHGENILAIEVSDKSVSVMKGEDYVGIAYFLHLRFSDGAESILSSNEVESHRGFYIPDRLRGNPRGWMDFNFNDTFWNAAKSTGPDLPFAAKLNDPETHSEVTFLSANAPSAGAQFMGERHLFRRKFQLNIGPNPLCDKSVLEPRVDPRLAAQPEGLRHRPVPPPPTSTPTAPPTATFTPTLTPPPVWIPTATRPLPYPKPTARSSQPPRVWNTPTPTPTFFFIPPDKVELFQEAPPKPTAPIVVLAPTPVATPEPPRAEAQTVVFDAPPANIYLSFADGSGIYRLDLFDQRGKRLRVLLEKKVIAQKETWVEWDGKNESGLDAPSGWYLMVYSKDGRELKKIFVYKSPQN